MHIRVILIMDATIDGLSHIYKVYPHPLKSLKTKKREHIVNCYILIMKPNTVKVGLCSSVDSVSDCRSRGRKFEPQLVHITFIATDHEIMK